MSEVVVYRSGASSVGLDYALAMVSEVVVHHSGASSVCLYYALAMVSEVVVYYILEPPQLAMVSEVFDAFTLSLFFPVEPIRPIDPSAWVMQTNQHTGTCPLVEWVAE